MGVDEHDRRSRARLGGTSRRGTSGPAQQSPCFAGASAKRSADPRPTRQDQRCDPRVGIGLALEELTEPGEVLSRPSLAAGNDPSRPYDLEPDRRVAEFKFGRWDAGSDAARKREAFKDLVGLAADDSERRAELYVLGSRPIRFLRETRSTARWALNKSIRMTELYERRFDSLNTPISAFVSGPAQAVTIMDLEQRLPYLFDPALDGTSD